MFSPDITESDAFLEMPASAHSLYFHLGMYADDDGFVNPRKIMRMLGSSEDDLKVLLSKRFLLIFASGVVVVKHWKINNLVRKDWYRPTQYVEEKSLLLIKENGAYTDDLENGGRLVNEPLTQVRLGKDSLLGVADAPQYGTSKEEEAPKKDESRTKDKLAIYKIFSKTEQPWWNFAQEKKAALSLFDLKGVAQVQAGKSFMDDHSDDEYCPQASTPYEYAKKLPALLRYKKKLDV